VIIPIYCSAYSQAHPSFKRKNDKILKAIVHVQSGLNRKSIWVIDRCSDRNTLFDPIIAINIRLIISLNGDRRMVWNRGLYLALDLAVRCECPMPRQLPE